MHAPSSRSATSRHVKVGVFDVDGILRGKYMGRDKVLLRAGEGVRLLRRGAGLGFQRPALRQRHLYRLAHRLSRRAGAHPARDLPRRAVRRRHAVLPRASSRRPPRRCARAALLRRVLERADEMGFGGQRRGRVRVLPVRGDAAFGAREGLPQPHATSRRASSAIRCCAPRCMPSSIRSFWSSCREMDFPLEGLHTETGPGVLEAAIDVTERAGSRRHGALFKTFTKMLAQRRGLDGDLHGQMVEGLAGPVGPSARVAERQSSGKPVLPRRGQAARHVRHDALVRRRPAGADAGTAGDGRLDGELLYAADPRLLGADRRRPGASRTAPCALRVIPGSPKSQRVEYRIAAADINPYIALAAAIGSGLWGIENQHRAGTRRSRAMPMRSNSPAERALPRTLYGGGGAPEGIEAGARAVRRCVRRALRRDARMGRTRIPQARSPIGKWPAISRSSERHPGSGAASGIAFRRMKRSALGRESGAVDE